MTQDLSADWIKNFPNLFQKQVKEEFDNLIKPNILIIGRTGVGKSSLINAIFGISDAKVGHSQPVTELYDFYSNPNKSVNLYDSAGWEGGSEGEEKFLKDTKDFLNRYRTENLQDRIHLVWYLIDASSARFTDFDTKILKDVLKDIPIFVILSKSDIATDEQISSLKDVIAQKTIGNRLIATIDVAASPMKKRGIILCEPYGLDEIVKKTIEILPDLLKLAFIAAQIVSLSAKEREATKAIVLLSTTAFAIGFSPIPFSDFPLLLTTQSALIARITVIYGFKPSQTIISTLGGITTSVIVGNVGLLLAEFFKFFPGIGTIVGSTIDATIAATLTAALGFSFSALLRKITKSIIEGKDVTYTKEESEDFIRKRFKQELERLQRSKRIEGYEPLEDES